MTVYIENPKESTTKTPGNNKWIAKSHDKINIQKSVGFLYINNNELEYSI